MYAILYVDDEEFLLDLGKMFIERMGDFSVDTAVSAKRALDVLKNKKYDAIISDYQMPEMDGIALLKHIRKTSDVPFILFTGKGREEVVIEALNSGADFYLQKGGEPKSQFTELIHKLNQAISRKKAEEAQKQAEQDLVRLNKEISIKFEEEKVISDFSQFLLNAGSVAEILDYFGNIIFTRSGADYLMLSRWDPAENVVRIHSLMGSGPNLEHICKQVNVAPESLKVPVAAINAHKKAIPTEPGLHKLDGGIHEISRGILPKPICIAIEKILGLQSICIYELVREGNLYGGITFGFQQGHEIQNQSLINTLSNILANGLWRIYSTNAIVHDREALRASEAKFRSILDNMQDIFYRTDKTGDLLLTSPSGAFMAGYDSADDMIGINVAQFIYTDPDERVTFLAALEKTGKIDNYPLVLKAHDGSLRNVLANSHYYYDDSGTILGAEGILHDVTDITIAEETIRASEEKFRSLVEHSLEPILILDFQGKVLFANNAVMKLAEIGDSTGITGRNVMEFIAPESREDVIRDFTRVSQGHDAFISHYQLLANGKKISVESIGKAITYDGRPADLISLRDITERKEHEEVMRQKNLMLTILNNLQRELAEIPAGMHIEELVLHKLSAISGSVVAIFSTYNPVEEVLQATRVEFEPEFLKNIPGAREIATKLLGKRPEDIRIPLNQETYQDISRSIVGIKKTLTEISCGKIPPLIGASVQKLADIDHFIHIAHIIDGELYGTSVIGLKPGQPDPSRELLESFAHIVAISLRRQQAEAELKESEKSYRGVFNTLRQAIYILDKEGNFIDVNEGAEAMYGYAREEFIGKTPEYLSAPGKNDLSAVGEHMQKALAGEPQLFEFWGLRKNNEIFPKEVRLYKGTYFGKDVVIAIGIDITERKQEEEALAESEERFRMLLQHVPSIAIQGYNLEGTTQYWNEAAEKLYGYTSEEALGKKLTDLIIPPEMKEDVRKSITYMGDTGQPIPASELSLMRKDGSRVEVFSHHALIKSSRSRMELFCIDIDLSDRKRAEEALHQANRKLKLLSGITRHDINNQLTVLQGYLAMLETMQPNTSPNEYLQEVSTAADHISSMIEFTKEYEMIGVNAPAWQDCRTLVDTATKQASLGKVKVKNDFPAGAAVFTDPLIARVFYNLIDNAVRHGGNITTIRFFVEERDGNLILVCEDNGHGVVTGEKEKIFEQGFGKNTGMGLFLTREILSITGITTRETGDPGNGARFEITVPQRAYQIPDTK